MMMKLRGYLTVEYGTSNTSLPKAFCGRSEHRKHRQHGKLHNQCSIPQTIISESVILSLI